MRHIRRLGGWMCRFVLFLRAMAEESEHFTPMARPRDWKHVSKVAQQERPAVVPFTFSWMDLQRKD